MRGGTTFNFVTEGIESALARARKAAGSEDVAIAGGAQTVRQYLSAGLIDGQSQTRTVQAAERCLRLRFVADEPVKAVPVYDLAVRSAPRLRGKRVHHLAADSELVEPLMKH